MIKLFKTNIPFSFLVIGLLTIVFSLSCFINQSSSHILFFEWYSDFFNTIQRNHILNISLTFAVVILTALIINRAFNKTSFYQKTTAIPALIYIVVLSTFKGIEFNPILIINLLFGLAFLRLVELDQNSSASHVGFNTGLIIGITFLFSFWLIPLAVVVFLSLSVFRPLIIKEWLLTLIGMLIPLVYLFGFKYLFSESYWIKIMPLDGLAVEQNIYDASAYILFFVIAIVAVFGLLKYYNVSTIIQRKQLMVFFQFFLVSFSVFLVIYFFQSASLVLFTIPLTMLLSVYTVNLKNDNYLNLSLLILLIINILRIFLF